MRLKVSTSIGPPEIGQRYARAERDPLGEGAPAEPFVADEEASLRTE